ncbi:MAG: DUF2207 domain-containing protein [Bacteroidales bacterium]|nr:DUF2207 domain-containing protein [Bacteroidales bacterium]
MGRGFISVLLLLCACIFAPAQSKVEDLSVRVMLLPDGAMDLVEVWKIDVDNKISEWYVARDRMKGIEVNYFSVCENPSQNLFENDGEWDVDRSREQKRNKYGIVHKANGAVELCWGVGYPGKHTFFTQARYSYPIVSLSDYDMLRFDIVVESDAPPRHVKVEIESGSLKYLPALDTTWVRAWAFGFEGDVRFEDGKVVMESSRPFGRNSRVSALLRFEKGKFNSRNAEPDKNFDSYLSDALEGSSYLDDDEDPFIITFLIFLFGLLVFIPTVIIWNNRNIRRKVFGVPSIKKLPWCREIPFNVNVPACAYVMAHTAESGGGGVATAFIMKMVRDGRITVSEQSRANSVDLVLNGNVTGPEMSPCEREFFEMLTESAGADGILQKNEFTVWARKTKNTARLEKWTKEVDKEARKTLEAGGWLSEGKKTDFTMMGQESARNLIGVRTFLKDFTLIDERRSVEAVLWRDYMIVAALFGIAEKVAKELQEINPEAFKQLSPNTSTDPVVTMQMIRGASVYSRSISSAMAAKSSSAAGYGGHSSMGGGHGFGGGGHSGGR